MTGAGLTLRNGTIVTPSSVIEGGDLLIENGRITAVPAGAESGRAGPATSRDPPLARRVDLQGAVVLPGFIDLHLHGAGGISTFETAAEAIAGLSERLARYGVTGYLASLIGDSRERTTARVTAIRDAARSPLPGAQVLGSHLEGPYLSPERPGTIPLDRIRDPDLGELRSWLEAGDGTVRMVTIAPELPSALKMIQYLHTQKVVAAIGHSNATFEEAQAGIDAGAAHATHCFNAMRGLHQRDPGALGAVLTDDRVTAEIICDFVHVHPAAIRLLLAAKGLSRTCVITDGVAQMGMPDGEYVSEYGPTVVLEQGAVRQKTGALAGGALPLHRHVRNLMTHLGLGWREIAQVTSSTPAAVLGLQDRLGAIEIGREATLTVLDDACDVVMALVAGRVVYDRNGKTAGQSA